MAAVKGIPIGCNAEEIYASSTDDFRDLRSGEYGFRNVVPLLWEQNSPTSVVGRRLNISKFSNIGIGIGIGINGYLDSPFNIPGFGGPRVFEGQECAPHFKFLARIPDGNQLNIGPYEGTLTSSPSLICQVQNVTGNTAYNYQEGSEISHSARPSRHHSLIYLMGSAVLFGFAFALMIAAFNQADYADERGLWWWWVLLLGYAVLSIIAAIHGYKLLTSANGSAEDIRVFPVIVAELELCDVQRQILFADFVETTHDAALEDRPEALDGVGVNCANNMLACGMIDHAMRKLFANSLVAAECVGTEQANFGRDGLADKDFELSAVNARKNTGDDIAFAFHSTNHGHFIVVMAFLFVPMPIGVFAANIGFIDLNDAAKLVHILFDQSSSDAMAHVPSGFVRAEAHSPHDLQCAHALLAGQHHMGDAIPVAKRLIGILEDGPGDAREPIPLRRTGSALPMKRLIGGSVVQIDVSTARATDALRPSAGDQIGLASRFIRECRLKLGDGHLVNWLLATGHNYLHSVGGYCHV
jgi:hypothetical protein